MAQPTLGTLTLPYPNSISTSHIRQGSYTKSLDGTTRRAVNSDKYIWTLGFQNMTINTFDSLKAIYDLKETQIFVYNDLAINHTVHIDIGERVFVPGNPSYYSSVQIVLTEA